MGRQRGILTKSEAFILKLCNKLDRQYRQNVELQVHLTAIYNLLLRAMDNNENEN